MPQSEIPWQFVSYKTIVQIPNIIVQITSNVEEIKRIVKTYVRKLCHLPNHSISKTESSCVQRRVLSSCWKCSKNSLFRKSFRLQKWIVPGPRDILCMSRSCHRNSILSLNKRHVFQMKRLHLEHEVARCPTGLIALVLFPQWPCCRLLNAKCVETCWSPVHAVCMWSLLYFPGFIRSRS